MSLAEQLEEVFERDPQQALDFVIRCCERAVREAMDEEVDAVKAAREFDGKPDAVRACRGAADEVREVARDADRQPGRERDAACAWTAYHCVESVLNEGNEQLRQMKKAIKYAARAVADQTGEREWQEHELGKLLQPKAAPIGFRSRLSAFAAGYLGPITKHMDFRSRRR
ncbi:MAG TPA: hypothetical protein VKR79_07650 [Gaiellaceae bacterium]|nr:hypothetical protein [Gaiellaceae bacterium]